MNKAMNSEPATLDASRTRPHHAHVTRPDGAASRVERDEAEPHMHAESATRDLLTAAQLADRWGVTTGHLANLRHQAEGIGYLKLGSRIAYRFADVVAYENAHYVSPG